MRDTSRLPLARAIGGLALPAILSFLLPNFYHVNDAWFLGKVGPDATNAMGLFQFISIANFGFILTLARGTQSLVGRRFGAGNLPGAELAIAQGLRLAVIVLVVLGTVEWLLVPDILRLMGGQGATVDAGVAYVRSLLLFLPFLFASPILEFSFQGMGDTRTPFQLQLMAVLANTGLNWLLVLPHALVLEPVADGTLLRLDGLELGPSWLTALLPAEGSLAFGGFGAAGAAVATGISRTISALVGFSLLVRRGGLVRLVHRGSYRYDRSVAREILRVGMPAGSSTLLYALVAAVITRLIARFGQDALGAYAIGFRGIESVSFMIVLGCGVATGTVAAHAVGAGDLQRARRAGHVGAALATLGMLGTTALFLAFPGELAGLFTDDAAIRATAAGYIAAMAFCQVPQALEMVYGDAMAGAGSSLRAALVSIPGNVLRIPLAFWLAGTWGLDGVWYAIVASAALKGLGMLALYLSGSWERAMHAARHMLDARP